MECRRRSLVLPEGAAKNSPGWSEAEPWVRSSKKPSPVGTPEPSFAVLSGVSRHLPTAVAFALLRAQPVVALHPLSGRAECQKQPQILPHPLLRAPQDDTLRAALPWPCCIHRIQFVTCDSRSSAANEPCRFRAKPAMNPRDRPICGDECAKSNPRA